MPLYNAERYLEHTLQTVLAQTYEDFILYISDNASTDRTQEICKDYVARDSRIKYIKNEVNVGAPGNYERCFTPASSEYFRWQNGDDPIEPTLIERCIEVLDEQPDVVLAYCKTNIIDENGVFLEHYDDKLHLMQDEPVARLQALLDSIGYQNVMYGLIRREPLSHTALMGAYTSSDLNLVGELCLYGKFFEVQEYLFNRRMHPESNSADRHDDEKQVVFWDPSKKKMILPLWRSFYEYFKAAFRAPISWQQKQRIASLLLRRMNWNRQQLGKEFMAFLQQ